MTKNTLPERAIRSFVRRSGRLTPGQRNALEQYWPIYGHDFQRRTLDIGNVCSEFESIKLEIGIGNGDALINMAENDPKALYFGIEVHQPGIGRCLKNINDRNLDNVRLISHDAIEVMQHMFPERSLDQILLFFPDPWHKKRHHKRRIVNQQFRDLACRLLNTGGSVHFTTDWQNYAEHMADELFSDQRFGNLGDGNGFVSRPHYRPTTHFEKRGLNLGHGVWDLVFEKISD